MGKSSRQINAEHIKQAKDAVSSGNTPSQYIKDTRGRQRPNPVYEYYKTIKQATAKKEQAAKNIEQAKKSGFQIRNVTLDRTTADIMAGKSNVPISQLNPEQQLSFSIASLNRQLFSGDISPDEYTKKTKQSQDTWNTQQQKRTLDFAWSSKIQGKSDRVKQDEQRAIAQSQGLALGTINDNSAKGSVNSQVSQNNLSNFVEAQRQPTTILQREERVKVTTPDGKERIFKNRATADKFISRIEGNYKTEIIGAVKPNHNNPTQKDDSFVGTYGGLDFLYGNKGYSFTGGLVQPAINFLDEYTQQKPKNYIDTLLMQFTQPVAGALKQGTALIGSLDNLGFQASEWITGRKSKYKQVEIKPTVDQPLITAIIEGQSSDQAIKNYQDYFKKYNFQSIQGELATFLVGAKGSKNLLKLVPVRGEKYSQPGIKIIQSQKTTSKTAINTPVIASKEVGIKTFSLGYGSKTKPIISKVGNKINLGSPNLSNVSVKVNAVTPKQIQRGVKMAADSTKYEQKINAKLIDKVFNITEESKDLAKTEKEIVDILTTGKKDTIINKQLGEGVFENVTKTEQPSFTGAISKAQKKIIDPVGRYEGSLSGYYFTLPKFLRTLGDVDLHADTFSKAARQIKRITPEIKPDTGRLYYNKISQKQQSVKQKVFDSKTGKKEKTIEILNPEEKDEFGVLQSIEGDTLFGKKIPNKSYKVKEGKTYGRQRQILKKFESLYSLQKDPVTGLVKLRPFEKRYKDVADSYALGRSAQAVEFSKDSKEYQRLDYLLDKFKTHFKTHENFDIDEYLSKNGLSKDATLSTDKSIIQKIGSNSGKSLSDSSRTIPRSAELTKYQQEKLNQDIKKDMSILNPRKNNYGISKTNTSLSKSMDSITKIKPLSLNISPPNRVKKPDSSIYNRIKNNQSPSLGNSPRYTPSPPIAKSPSMLNKIKSPAYSPSPSMTKSPPIPKRPIQRPLERSPLGRSSTTTKDILARMPQRRAVPFGIIDIRNTTKTSKGIKRPNEDFLGNTRISDITGFRTKEKDYDLGIEKTSRLYKEQLSKEKRKSSNIFKLNSKGLLGNKKSKTSLW